MNTIRASALLVSSVLLGACVDRTPVAPVAGPPSVPGPSAEQRVECVARVTERTLVCGLPGAPGAIRGNLYGGQGLYVRLASTDVGFDAGSGIFSATVTVQNLLPYALGVHEGAEADSAGVKVFFHAGPIATAGSGTVEVENADGVGAFTAAGQPFFKYPQVIDPQQASLPRVWRFHLDPGVTAFAFSVLVSARQQASAFRVVAPEPHDDPQGDSLTVEVVGSAPPALTHVRASLPSGSTLLAYVGNNRWRGKVRRIGSGLILRVVATAPADSLVQLVPLTLGLFLTVPGPGGAVRQTNSLRVAGTCATTASPCTVTAQFEFGTVVSSTGSTFDFTLPAATTPIPGVAPVARWPLTVTATDAHGRTARIERSLYFIQPAWQEVTSAGTQGEAVSTAFLLYSDSSAATGVRALRLRDRATGADALVRPNIAGRYFYYARTTSVGATFMLGDSLFEYHGGALTFLGIVRGDDVDNNGRWVAWVSPSAVLYVRDVVAGVTTTIADESQQPTVGPNGDVVFVRFGTVRRYRAGVITNIAPGSYPRTDGNLIIFASGSVRLYDGSTTTTTVLSSRIVPNAAYGVRNGWAFFNVPGDSGGLKLASRAPDGTIRIVSTEGLPFYERTLEGVPIIHAMGDNGEVVYHQGVYGDPSITYSAPPYTVRTSVGGGPGRYQPSEVFFGSELYSFLGPTLYRIVVP